MPSVKLDLLKHKEQVHERRICPKTNFTSRLYSPLKQHTFAEPWCSHQTDKIRALGDTKSETVSDVPLFSDIKKRKHLIFFFKWSFVFVTISGILVFFSFSEVSFMWFSIMYCDIMRSLMTEADVQQSKNHVVIEIHVTSLCFERFPYQVSQAVLL